MTNQEYADNHQRFLLRFLIDIIQRHKVIGADYVIVSSMGEEQFTTSTRLSSAVVVLSPSRQPGDQEVYALQATVVFDNFCVRRTVQKAPVMAM